MERSKTVAQLDVLSAIASNKPKLTKAIVQNSDDTLIDAISECALLIVSGTIPVTKKSKAERVQKVIPWIKLLSKKSVSRKKKRNFLLS